jgi:hypothetical protein
VRIQRLQENGRGVKVLRKFVKKHTGWKMRAVLLGLYIVHIVLTLALYDENYSILCPRLRIWQHCFEHASDAWNRHSDTKSCSWVYISSFHRSWKWRMIQGFLQAVRSAVGRSAHHVEGVGSLSLRSQQLSTASRKRLCQVFPYLSRRNCVISR